MKVSFVEGARAHNDALLEALATAKQQVVVSSPWVPRLESREIRVAIDLAVQKGVVVIVSWGVARGEAIPSGLASLRAELPRSPAGGVLLAADRAALSHANLIICDHDWAIVTAANFLSSSPDRITSELGVRLTSPPPHVEMDPTDARTAPSHPISELLRWARASSADHRVGSRILESPILFGLAEGSKRLHEPPEILAPQDNVLAAKLWHQTWEARARELREDLEQTGTYGFLIEGASHRDVLFDALATAERRLLIESPKLGAMAASTPFVEAVLEARVRGVDVAIRFAEREPAGPEGDARWNELATHGVRIFQVDTNAKLLVCDEWALTTSFNFLSFEGRGRRELGVQVVDEAIAELAAARFA